MGGAASVRTALLVAALLAPVALAQVEGWEQNGGGPGRPGVAFLADPDLDVLFTDDITAPDEALPGPFSHSVVETPDGLLAFTTSGGACALMRVELPAPVRPDRTKLDDCSLAFLAGYDAAEDLLIVCSLGGPSAPVLQARERAIGAIRWSLSPAQAGVVAPTQAAPWICADAVIEEEGTIVAALSTLGETDLVGETTATTIEHRIVKVRAADGALVWSKVVSQGPPVLGSPGAPFPGDARSPQVLPFAIARADSGYLVTMQGYCACERVYPPGLAWMRLDGTVVNSTLWDRTLDRVDPAVSIWPASDGPRAAAVAAQTLFVVDPAQAPALSRPLHEFEPAAPERAILPSPAWWERHLIVPLESTVVSFDPADLSRARWVFAPGSGYYIIRVLLAPPADLFVLLAEREGNEDGFLVRLDLESGAELSRLPTGNEHTFNAKLLPTGDGRVLLWDVGGFVALLGRAPESAKPKVHLDNTYPAPGETVALTTPAGDANYSVAWGDAPSEFGGPGQTLTHRYGTGGARSLRLTAIYPDGRTATSTTVVRVGETPPAPPPRLNAAQRALAPENQNITFGVLGLVLTIMGALVALLARRRRRSLLEEELRRIEAIRASAGRDTLAAVAELEVYRDRVLGMLAAGRLDDAQFSVIELRVSRLLQTLRLRLLGPFAGRVSPEYRHLLEAALEDGRVTREEGATLVAGLDAEAALSPDERSRLASLIRVWQSDDRSPEALRA